MPILKPHETQNKRGVAVVVRENETMYLNCLEGRLVIQNGKVMDQSGNELTSIPDWFWEAYANVSPEMQEKLGLPMKVKK